MNIYKKKTAIIKVKYISIKNLDSEFKNWLSAEALEYFLKKMLNLFSNCFSL